MASKKIHFTNARGQKLAARLELPLQGRVKSYALLAHCFTCSKDLKALRAIARSMTHIGMGVVRFDFTGLGQSEGEFAETTFSSDVSDLVEVATQVEQEYGPVELLVGHSLGGAACLLAASRLDNVRAVATIGAPAEPVHVAKHLEDDIPTIEEDGEAVVELGGRPFTVRREFLEDLEETHLREVISELGRPLLILHAPKDEVVDINQAKRIFEAARHPRSFVSLDKADHLLSDEDQAEYVGRLIASWAQRYISPLSPQDWREDPAVGQIAARTEKGLRTEVNANGFALIADEPASLGGTDTGPTPQDFLSAALASCTSITLRLYADRKEWALDAVTVNVDYEEVDEEDRFHCFIAIEGELSDKQRQRLIEIAERCPVHRILQQSAVVETTLDEE